MIGAATIVALLAYFVLAIGFHLRARDTLVSSIGAVVMLAVCATVGLVSFA